MDEWMSYDLPEPPPLCPHCGAYHDGSCLIEALDRTLLRIEADYAAAERGRTPHGRVVDGEGE